MSLLLPPSSLNVLTVRETLDNMRLTHDCDAGERDRSPRETPFHSLSLELFLEGDENCHRRLCVVVVVV